MKLTHKFLAAILLYTLLLIALLAGAVQFSAHRNFSDYINKVELESLDNLAQALANVYQDENGWESFRDNARAWKDMVQRNLPEQRPRFPQRSRPLESGLSVLAPVRPSPSNPLPRARNTPEDLLRRLSLFDADKHLVFGNPRLGDQSFRPIESQGKTLGWIGLKKRENLTHPLDSAFIKQQSRAFFIIAGAAFALGGFLSFFLARLLVRPINTLIQGVRLLGERRFDVRLEVARKDELGQLAQTFNDMAQTLLRYENARRQWLSDVAHELRTPLSVLQVEIEAMQDGVKPVDAKGLESLRAEVLHLGRIVQDLHELSLAESKMLRLERQKIHPVTVLRETLVLFGERCSREGLSLMDELGSGPGPWVLADKDRLVQLFSNLLENAMRYADKPGSLRVGQGTDQSFLMLHFEDSGPGVAGEHLDKLFERFYRVDASRSRQKGGSGIGLALCKAIVDAHGGDIRARAGASGGLRIEVAFPLAGTGPKELA